jgi:hypothetical protein
MQPDTFTIRLRHLTGHERDNVQLLCLLRSSGDLCRDLVLHPSVQPQREKRIHQIEASGRHLTCMEEGISLVTQEKEHAGKTGSIVA